ncbi:MAG: glycosyltransferase, partial [Terrimicrobiaceae bacterium]|nr:glycosyltransferase [Terrimicrobiaceae bacterium]
AGDVVVDGETGWLVPAGDAEALAAALRAAASDIGRLEEMGRRARQRILDHFTWDHFRARLLEAYSAAFARAQSA